MKNQGNERGSALIVSMLTFTVLIGFSVAYTLVSTTHSSQVRATLYKDTTQQSAWAGFEMARRVLTVGHDTPLRLG